MKIKKKPEKSRQLQNGGKNSAIIKEGIRAQKRNKIGISGWKLVLLATSLLIQHSYQAKIRKFYKSNPFQIDVDYETITDFEGRPALIKYTREVKSSGKKSKRAYFSITSTSSDFLSNILLLKTYCEFDDPYQNFFFNNYYKCKKATFKILRKDNSEQKIYPSKFYFILDSQEEFNGFQDLKDGFTLTSSVSIFQAGYSIHFDAQGDAEFVNVTSSFIGNTESVLIWVFLGVIGSGFLVILLTRQKFGDHRRVPLHTLLMVGLGYIPLALIMERGVLANPESGYAFVSLFIVIFGIILAYSCCARRSRRQENNYILGVLANFAYFAAVTLCLDSRIQFVLVLPFIPLLALVVENCVKSKNRGGALKVWLLSFIQIAVYAASIGATGFLNSAEILVSSTDDFEGFLGTATSALILSFLLIICSKNIQPSGNWKVQFRRTLPQPQDYQQPPQYQVQVGYQPNNAFEQPGGGNGQQNQQFVPVEPFQQGLTTANQTNVFVPSGGLESQNATQDLTGFASQPNRQVVDEGNGRHQVYPQPVSADGYQQQPQQVQGGNDGQKEFAKYDAF